MNGRSSLAAALVASAILIGLDSSMTRATASQVSVFAGDGQAGFAGDGGPAVDAQLNYPTGITSDAQGNLYVSDRGNSRIRKVSSGGTITTLADDAGCASDILTATISSKNVLIYPGCYGIVVRSLEPGDDFEQIFTFNLGGSVDSLAVSGSGKILYAKGSQVFEIPDVTDAAISPVLVAGTGVNGYSGDGGPATQARLSTVSAITFTAQGELLIADCGNGRIRKVNQLGEIATWAGTNTSSAGSVAWRSSATSAPMGCITGLETVEDGSVIVKAENPYASSGYSAFGKINSSGEYCRFGVSVDQVGENLLGRNFEDMTVGSGGSLYFVVQSQILKVSSPSCASTPQEVIENDSDLDLFQSVVAASSSPTRFTDCTAGSVIAVNDVGVQDLLDEIGTTLNSFKTDQALSGAFLDDHQIVGNYSPFRLESDSLTSVFLSSYRGVPVSQRPVGAPGSRRVGTDVYVRDSLITRAIPTCGGIWGSFLYVVDKRIFWPPSALDTMPVWGFATTPTSSRIVIFQVGFTLPIKGLTSANFQNMGNRTGCTFQPIARDRSSDYSTSFDILATCPGPGTVGPRLRTSTVSTPYGTRVISDPYGANIVDMQNNPILTVTKPGLGTGVVESTSISAIECGVLCAGVFNQGATVTLKATADPGSIFDGWAGACSGTGSCSVRMNSAQTVSASFSPAAAITIMKSGQGQGGVTLRAGAAPCSASSPNPCVVWQRYGTSIVLTATPSRGSTFKGWLGDCVGTGSCTLAVNDNKVLYAIFERT